MASSWGVCVGGLLFGDGADEDGMEMVLAGQGDLDGQLVLRGPFGALFFHDALHFQQVGQRDGAGCGGDEEGGVGAEAEQGAEFTVEGVGHVFPGGVVVEVAAVGRVLDVLPVGHGAHELLDLAGVSVLEGPKLSSGIGPCVHGALGVLVACVGVALCGKQADELQTTQLELEIAAAGLEDVAALAGPLDGGLEVLVVPQGVQDVVHLGKVLLQLRRVEGAVGGALVPGLSEAWIRRVEGGLVDEGGGDVELALAEKMHGDGAVDEGRVGREGVIFGRGEGLVLELLRDMVSVDVWREGGGRGGGGGGRLTLSSALPYLFRPE